MVRPVHFTQHCCVSGADVLPALPSKCRTVKITILGDEGVPIQVDGEAWIQPPGVIKIQHKNRAQMLTRDRVSNALGLPLWVRTVFVCLPVCTWWTSSCECACVHRPLRTLSSPGRTSSSTISPPCGLTSTPSSLSTWRQKRKPHSSRCVPVPLRSSSPGNAPTSHNNWRTPPSLLVCTMTRRQPIVPCLFIC